MILSTVVFLGAISVIAAAAALTLEAGALRVGRAARWFWAGSLAMGPALLLWGRLVPTTGPSAEAPVFFLPELTLTPGPVAEGSSLALAELGVVVGVLWLGVSVAFVGWLWRTHTRLLRERGSWEPSRVLERPVFVSGDRGPAVAGILRPWIVLPRWSLALPEAELSMVLLHEEEHVRAGDTLLLAGALALVALTPWNPVTWWQLRRLRLAMEMDCDRRVLRREPDPGRYGSSLLSVAARAHGPSLGLAAFTERSLSIERRILAMTTKITRRGAVGGGLMVALGAVVAAQACGVDNPFAPDVAEVLEIPAPTHAQVEAEPAAVGEPTFTPFTDAPAITNRQEVIQAMEASYPPLLRDAGIGGTVRVYFFIDETGVVRDVRIDKSSGHAALDDAALRVAGTYRFKPAENRGEPVPVWVSFPITFQVR